MPFTLFLYGKHDDQPELVAGLAGVVLQEPQCRPLDINQLRQRRGRLPQQMELGDSPGDQRFMRKL